MSAGSAPPHVDATVGARLGGLVLYLPLIVLIALYVAMG
jgi:hypothetical protein